MQITWNCQWVTPYESQWCSLEKIKFVNYISTAELANVLGIKNIDSKNTSYMQTCNHILLKLSNAVENYSSPPHSEWISILLGSLSHELYDEKYFRPYLTFCPQCILKGHHSLYHQLIFLNKCYVHNIPLQTSCPSCNKKILLNHKNTKNCLGFNCTCGYNLLKTYDYRSLFDNFEFFNVDLHLKPYSNVNSILRNPGVIYSYDLLFSPLFKVYNPSTFNPNTFEDIHSNTFDLSRYNFRVSISKNDYSCNSPLLNDKKLLLRCYINAYKSISKNLRRKYPLINKFVRNVKTNYLFLKYTLDSPMKDLCNGNIDIFGFAYMMWRRDIEGHTSIKTIHSPFEATSRGNFDSPLETMVQKSNLFYYLFMEYQNNLRNNAFKDSKNFWICFERILPIMMAEHFNNWLNYANNQKEDRASDLVNINARIEYLMPLFVVSEDKHKISIHGYL